MFRGLYYLGVACVCASESERGLLHSCLACGLLRIISFTQLPVGVKAAQHVSPMVIMEGLTWNVYCVLLCLSPAALHPFCSVSHHDVLCQHSGHAQLTNTRGGTWDCSACRQAAENNRYLCMPEASNLGPWVKYCYWLRQVN